MTAFDAGKPGESDIHPVDRRNARAVNSRRQVLLNFVFSIVASWVASPLGVLVLHFLGYGSDPYLVTLLLALSATGPFQLLCNEYLAAGAARQHFHATSFQVLVLIACQMGISGYAAASISPSDRLVVSSFLAISTIISYQIAIRYYRVNLAGACGYRDSIIIGAAPGITTLLVFLLAGYTKNIGLIFFGALLPAIVQWALVRVLIGNSAPDRMPTPAPSWIILMLLLAMLSATSIGSVSIRAQVAAVDERYMALILTGLNVLGTMIIMATRTAYLLNRKGKWPTLIGVTAALGLTGTALLLGPLRLAALFILFLALQIFTAALIDLARHAAYRIPFRLPSH